MQPRCRKRSIGELSQGRSFRLRLGQLFALFARSNPFREVAGVEAHLRDCASCAAELAGIRESSRLLRETPFDELTRADLAKIHDAVDDVDDYRIWRIGGSLGLVAASILPPEILNFTAPWAIEAETLKVLEPLIAQVTSTSLLPSVIRTPGSTGLDVGAGLPISATP